MERRLEGAQAPIRPGLGGSPRGASGCGGFDTVHEGVDGGTRGIFDIPEFPGRAREKKKREREEENASRARRVAPTCGASRSKSWKTYCVGRGIIGSYLQQAGLASMVYWRS